MVTKEQRREARRLGMPMWILYLSQQLAALRGVCPYFCEQIDQLTYTLMRSCVKEKCADKTCTACAMTFEQYHEQLNRGCNTITQPHLKAGDNNARFDQSEYSRFVNTAGSLCAQFKRYNKVIKAMMLNAIKAHVHGECENPLCYVCQARDFDDMSRCVKAASRYTGQG